MELKNDHLLIITDLWGMESGSYLSHYLSLLSSQYEIEILAARSLAGISPFGLSQDRIHNEFIEGGIDAAVGNLLETYSGVNVSILAFSIGGTIAWKAMQKGLIVKNLIAISSTRLRFETETPAGNIFLHFGSEDTFAPEKKWNPEINTELEIHDGAGHDMYKDSELAKQFVAPLLNGEI